jgi:hypothetical protein
MSADKLLSKKIGDLAAAQSIAEIGLGSLLHSFHVPLSGHFLSLNQTVLLSFAAKSASSRKEAVGLCSGMAAVVALLKSLSPAGKKLLPMLAIATQGLLYSLGVALLGLNVLGVALGASFLSIWGFAQPLLITWLLFGETFFDGLVKLWNDIAKALHLNPELGISIIIGVLIFKATLASVFSVWAFKARPLWEQKYKNWLSSKSPSLKKTTIPSSGWRGAIGDVLSPWFIFSICFALLVFYFFQNKSFLDGFLYALRILSVSFLFFWLVRSAPQSWIERALKKFPLLAAAYGELVSKRSRT